MWLVEEQMRHVQDERKTIMKVEQKCLLSAENEMFEEKEETSVDVMARDIIDELRLRIETIAPSRQPRISSHRKVFGPPWSWKQCRTGIEKCLDHPGVRSNATPSAYIHDDTMTCLQPAERKIECESMHVVLQPIVSPIHLDRVKYFLEDQTIELLEPDLDQNGLPRPETGNEIPTRRQRRKEAEKSTRLENVQFRLRECVVENGEDFVPLFTGEGTDNGNLVKLIAWEVMEAELRSEESAL
ncbi:uncharacterized protein TNIN_371061 [Trichonephila inaurata madagascariensis]|uniref:Uncharacterized protein n=1 Tax=Trichonephila inaurata madagascariensis TaxID=2747483 RepID=A0A8X6MHK7_9ARAC|nr:uncharacterized protein TNIN_371061 [Trichonephila inaurata madagascariensis]